MNITNNLKKTSEEKPSLVIYSRISKEKTHANKELSLDNQVSLGIKYAETHGFKVIAVFKEIASAKKTSNRPEFNDAVALVLKEKATLFLYQLSRGFRSTLNSIEVSERLDKAGANLVSYSEDIASHTPSGKLYFTIISAMAQFEREMIGLRTKDALAHKKANGGKLGGTTPFGFKLIKKTGKLSKNKREQEAISRMMYLREEGYSYNRIADILTKEKVATKTGAEWYGNTVRLIINEAKKRKESDVLIMA